MRKVDVGTLALAATLAALSSSFALAQPARGGIAGTVVDSTGAALAGASITIRSAETGEERVVTSGADGSFAAADLPAGRYTVTAETSGFATARREVRVTGGETQTVSFDLDTVSRAEEITVTAMKGEAETIHETPFSVAAFTGDLMRSRGIKDIEDVASNVAGFTVQQLGPGQSQVAMRGISAGQIVRDQPGVKEQVGVYLDESVVSMSLFTPDVDLFDVSRVEVLRGPQGTLFGSGSLSGTVRYITGQPEIGAKRYFAELDGNTVSDGDQGGSAKVGFNAPLGDRAAVRAVGYYNRLAGYVDAVRPDLSIDKDVNSGYRTGGRLAFTLTPNDRLIITPRVMFQKVEMDGWNRVDVFNVLANPFTTTRPPVTLGDLQEFAQLQESFSDEFLLADLNLSYDFGGATLTSITSYVDRDILVVRDTTALSAFFLSAVFGVSEDVYTLDGPLSDATQASVFTQELRLSGDSDRVRWVVGGFYSRSDRDYGQDLTVVGFEDATGIPTRGLQNPKDSLFYSDLAYDLKQFNLFGEATVKLTDAFSVTGGLRYYNFSEDKQQIFDGIFGSPDLGNAVASQPGDTDADGVAPRLILSYEVSDTTNVNAQVARGFRLGGINDPLNEPICTPEDLATFRGREAWKDETVWNYEVGVKNRIAENRGAFNVTGFLMDISNLQATVTAGSCSSRLIYNVPEARSQGFEAELELAPDPSFDFAISATFTDSELRSTVEPVADTGILEGRRLPTVPRFQLAAAATYHRSLGDGLEGYLTGTYRHMGDRFTQVNDEDLGTLEPAGLIGGPLTVSQFNYDPRVPAYDLLNARLGVRGDRWEVAAYANNLTNERAVLAFDREAGTQARIFNLVNQPRTIGIELRFRN